MGKEGLEGGVGRKRLDDSGLGVVRATSRNRKWKSGSCGDRGGKVSSRSNRRRTKEQWHWLKDYPEGVPGRCNQAGWR